MSKARISPSVTLLDLTGTPKQREEYVRRLVGNYYKLGADRFDHVLRLGAQGTGRSPHYKFEIPTHWTMNDGTEGIARDTSIIYNGLNHERMTAFEVGDTNEGNWSLESMTFAEVEAHFSDLRARPRRV